jgi:hypothetical protein
MTESIGQVSHHTCEECGQHSLRTKIPGTLFEAVFGEPALIEEGEVPFWITWKTDSTCETCHGTMVAFVWTGE